jgi:hypothetical protein
MFALYDAQRATLLRVAVMIIVGACATLPLTISPTSVIANADPITPAVSGATIPQVPGRMQYPDISIARDPFVADNGVLARNGVAQTTATTGNTTSLPLVRAIVSGDDPRALVEVNGSVRVLAVGDKLGGDAVASINQSGIELASGIHLGIVHP